VSVINSVIDTWIEHLSFAAPRPTEMGDVDGYFYGLLAVVGDASAGSVTQLGSISSARKTDWVYVVKAVSAEADDDLAGGARISINTGPRISTGLAPSFPRFSVSGDIDQVAGINLSTTGQFRGGTPMYAGMLAYGDPTVAGSFALLENQWETNTLNVVYQVSIWGWLVSYNNFFRGSPTQIMRDARRLRGIR